MPNVPWPSAARQTENAQLREQLLDDHQESLHTARGRLGVQGAEQSALEDEVFARADRIDALQAELAAQAHTLAEVRAALEASEQRCGRLDVDGMNLRATIERRDSRIATSRSRSRRAPGTRGDCSRRSSTMRWPRSIPRSPICARSSKRATGGSRSCTRELAAAMVLATEKDADLQVAEESIRNLEIEVRDKTGKLEEASVTVEEWRAVIAESQRSILQRDTRIQQLEADLEKRVAAAAAADSASQTGEEIALEGPARVLIRTDGNTDFVHVLGRRTRIGRGSDNEVVLDTKHISRYHAVLLAGPTHTTIEDLKSTNGVFVNGKRVSRQVLKDGDRVTIGKTHFRYSVRN